MSGCLASGIDMGKPSIRPAEVIGSWATKKPPGRTARRMRSSTTAGSYTCKSKKRQKARSTSSGSSRSSPAWVMAITCECSAAAAATTSRARGSLSTA